MFQRNIPYFGVLYLTSITLIRGAEKCPNLRRAQPVCVPVPAISLYLLPRCVLYGKLI